MKLLKQTNIGRFGVRPANYSGITHISGNRYAVVDDKEFIGGFMFLDIYINHKTGKIENATYSEPTGFIERKQSISNPQSVYRDCEGCAYCTDTNTIFISGEEDQRIAEYDLNGISTGRELQVPQYMQRHEIEDNYGFEILTYNHIQKRFWTTTEATLLKDGKRSNLDNKDVQNRLRLQSFGLDLKPSKMFAYKMDAPETRKNKGNHVHGVPSMVALDDGSLIIMEREAFIPRFYFGSFCRVKLYIVHPEQHQEIQENTDLSKIQEHIFLKKRLLCDFTTRISYVWNFANYEGMCLGPRLEDGRQTLLLISDSQGGHGNAVYRLKDYIKVIIL